MKHLCYDKDCNEIAVWMYAPCSEHRSEASRYFCEEHVSRGCSCNIIKINYDPDSSEDLEEYKDDQGRLLPCCEYDYCEDGYDKLVLCDECKDFFAEGSSSMKSICGKCSNTLYGHPYEKMKKAFVASVEEIADAAVAHAKKKKS